MHDDGEHSRSVALWRRAMNVLLPPAEGDPVIARDRFERDGVGDYCRRCGATAAPEAQTVTGCPHCRGEPIAWSGVWRIGAYGDDVRDWVLAYKFRRAWGWGGWFGRQLADAARAMPIEPPEVVTGIPLHWRRRLVRGFDQASLIARAFARHRGVRYEKLLRRVRSTHPQSRISDHARRRDNVRGAFALRAPLDLAGATVWLIDDVKTSGSTARVCAHLLRRAGAARVNLAVVAVADPKSADFQWV